MSRQVLMTRNRFDAGGVLRSVGDTVTLTDSDALHWVAQGWATAVGWDPAAEPSRTGANNRPAQGAHIYLGADDSAGCIGRIRLSLPNTATAAETVTVTWHLRDGTTATASSTIAVGAEEDWPINLLGLDYLTWASTGSAAVLETL